MRASAEENTLGRGHIEPGLIEGSARSMVVT